MDFNSPNKNPQFTKYWDTFIQDIQGRENLKPSHLLQLEILCDLCIERDELKEGIKVEGRIYESEGRNGVQIKIHPFVQQMNRTVSEIRNYSKMLGLLLVKDTKFNKDEEENEFE